MNEACDRAFDGVMAKVTDDGWMTQVSVRAMVVMYTADY
jgi:hypothetical protein